MKNYQVIMIGAGPAGVSASLYTARAGLRTLIVGKDGGALEKAEMIGNYYGIGTPVSGRELFERGLAQARGAGAEYVRAEVVGLGFEETMTVSSTAGKFSAECVIIATGASRFTPDIRNVREFEGRGVSYCAVCDAFFCRGKDVAVVGGGKYALCEAEELASAAKKIYILTDGTVPEAAFPEGMEVIGKKIASVEGNERVEAVVFGDGTSVKVSGVFLAYETASSRDLAKKLGAAEDGGRIVVKADMSTNIPGLFAAGDCTGGLLQISKAVYEGTVAGMSAIKFIKNKSGKELPS